MNIQSILRQPFPHRRSWNRSSVTAISFGVFIIVFLLVFRPFGMDGLSWTRLLRASLVYGFITFASIFIVSGISPRIFPNYFKEEAWTNGKEILMVAITLELIVLVNYFVSPLIVETKLTFSDALWFHGVTLVIGLLPISLYILLRQNQLLKKYRTEAGLLQQKLREKQSLQLQYPEETTADGVVTIEGDYQNERLSVPVDQLYMIQSANNYVKVYFEQKDRIAYSVLRLTMKKVEDILVPHNVFFRCHRTYIINLDKVKEVEGNAQGYKVTMEGIEESIPISRNFSSEFADKLLAIRKQSIQV